MSEEAIKIFYSYSRQDLDMRNTLEDHLSTLKRARRIKTWHDLELEAGTEWERDIQEQLNTADIILLLVSRNFIASEYCYSRELERAIARHHAGEARVIPVILRPCDWNHPDVPFSKLNVLPTHAKPITSWADQDEAFTVVAQRIRETVDQLRAKKLVEPQAKDQQENQQLTQKEAEQQAERERIQREQQQAEEWERELLARKKAEQKATQERIFQQVTRKELQECDSARILFIKNVKHPEPGAWAYPPEHMRQTESRTFELMWRASSHGVNQPESGDLMILHQRAKVTHIVEFLDDQVRETETGLFRWVRAVWLSEKDWNQLPHQKDILGFSPRYADGNTHSLSSLGFATFHKAWNSLEEFQQHIFRRLTQSEAIVTTEDDLTSEKGVDYTRLRDLLKVKRWEEADHETATRMLEALNLQNKILIGSQDIQNFSLTDLHTIDQLWVKYSYGKFGFSVQRRILDNAFCNSKITPETCLFDNDEFTSSKDLADRISVRWRVFGELLGWYERDRWIMKINYSQELTNKPEGYLPLLGQPPSFSSIPTKRRLMPWWWALLLHLQPWEL